MAKVNYGKLPKAFKKKWVEALRSGKFKQGKNRLKSSMDEDTYCCLGVACKIMHPKTNIGELLVIPKDENKFKKVPNLIKGMNSENNLVAKLTTMNDGTNGINYSFKQIANWIEKHL